MLLSRLAARSALLQPQLRGLSAPTSARYLQKSTWPQAVTASRFAVVLVSGTQHKVAADDVICVEKMKLAVGTRLVLGRILLVGESGSTVIGAPLVNNATVVATVEEQGNGPKVIVFKKKRRKGYRRWRGYRARLTLLRVLSIELPADIEHITAGSRES